MSITTNLSNNEDIAAALMIKAESYVLLNRISEFDKLRAEIYDIYVDIYKSN